MREIKSTKDLTHYFGRWLIYGDPGTNKTRLSATFPEPLFLAVDTEGGVLSLRDKDVAYISVNDPDDVIEVLEEIIDDLDNGSEIYGKYKTLVIDSLTILQENQIENLMAGRREHEEKKRKKDARADWRVDRSQRLNLTDADWGAVTSALRSMIILAHSLPMHIIWITLCEREMAKPGPNRDVEVISGSPMIYTKKAARKFGGVCDFLWYADVVESKQRDIYRIHTRPFGPHIGRSRDDLPPTLKSNFNSFAKELGLEPTKKTKTKKKKKK